MKNLKILWLLPILVLVIGIVAVIPFNQSDNQSNLWSDSNFLVDTEQVSLEKQLAAQGDIKKFASLEELQSFLENNQSAVNGSYYGGMAPTFDSVAMNEGMVSTKAVSAEATGLGGATGPVPDHSTTNVQVAGVDEADIVKTDGNNIYALSQQELYIIKAYPAEEASVQSIIKFENSPTDLYIKDNKLVVLGSDYQIFNKEMASSFIRRGAYSFIKVFDVSQADDPKLEKELQFEGNYNQSRLIGDYLYFITSTSTSYIEGEPLLPRVIVDGQTVPVGCTQSNCLAADVYYFPLPYPNYNFTNVFSLDLNDLQDSLSMNTYLFNGSQNIYASLDNLYITYTKYLDNYEIQTQVIRGLVYPYLNVVDKQKIASIEVVDSYILNDQEKQNKVRQILEKYLRSLSDSEQQEWSKNIETAVKDKYTELSDQLQTTVIHKIALDKTKLSPVAQAEVPGRVLDQFSLDEYDSYLRLATTKDNINSWYFDEKNESDNRVYVLDAKLKTVGELKGLASGERIYSSRFMGNRLYLVTFKQVDPLFAIDLSNPKKPTVLGSLKIPGFSEYIHPYDENTLIGFGKDTYTDEYDRVRVRGLKLSLFDVSNPAEPKELDTYLLGDQGSYSEVLDDHKALLFSKEKDLLALPVSLRSPDYGDWNNSFNGVLVFSLKDKKFNLRGQIGHQQSGSNWQDFYNNQVRRSLYIEDNLYTFSYNLLKVNSLNDLSELKVVPLVSSDHQIIRPVEDTSDIETIR